MTSVCIAVCTFRRAGPLATLLDRLAAIVDGRTDVSILLIDNAPEGGAAPVLEAAPSAVRERARLVHLGAGNIATARNTVFDEAPEVDFLALLDDDEVPDVGWLDAMLATQRSTGADFVIGPVRPEFPPSAPRWIVATGSLALAEPDDATPLVEGITGNALLRTAAVRAHGLRFDETLGHAGGEDQLFFRTAVWKGASMVFSAAAVVREPVPPARTTFRFVVRRDYRIGNTLGLLDRGAPGWPPGRPFRRFASAGFWSVRGLGRALAGAVRLDQARTLRGLIDVGFAAGMVSGLLGRRFDAYAPGGPSPVGSGTGRPVIVVVADEDPAAQAAGHSRYLAGMLRHLDGLGARIVLLITSDRLAAAVSRPRPEAPWEVRSPAARQWRGRTVARPRALLRQVAWSAFRYAPHRLQRVADTVRTRWRHRAGVDHVVGQPLGPETQQWVLDELTSIGPAAVIYNTLFAIPAEPPPIAASYVLCHDVVSDRAAALAAVGYSIVPAGFDAGQESAALARVPHLVAIQWDDATRLRELAPGATVVVAPPGFDPVPIRAGAPTAGRVLFVGSGSLHNVDGLRWFLDEVWPLVTAASTRAELHVVGTVCARVASPPARVVLEGEVDDLQAHYAAAAVAIVPLRAGSGLKIKLVEAMANGIAVVTTTVGAQGLTSWDPAPFALADTAAGFAAAVVAIVEDDAHRVELEGRARDGAQRFAPETAYAALVAELVRAGVMVG